MTDVLLVLFILTLVYLMTKTPKITPEKPTSTPAKAEQPATAVASKTTVKKTTTAQKTPKKSPEVATKAQTEQTPVVEATKPQAETFAATITSTPKAEQPQVSKVTPKKLSPAKKAPKKPETVVPEPVAATPEISAQERTGLTAGSIWHYLAANGATSVAKLIKELPEEEKIIQRSIGWLAQEDKITLSIVDRAETIALKE
ncbi:MAG: winged helix-turn-helix domain-containing protein [Methylomonas sp.]|jgi:predicted DNA-binding transcriptional regulator AlpA|uniref:winged helix-turn-helix domain-containing protein n=1 Tax=Methylomonas sp. TaxID=418 RepID=UPI0025E97B77|nr:winged helix-turn-helix domain-containing protein [Methylomonas sp.]MCK9609215.1 winged helix-turn-helix domain-containing protein [Methylomonas sp.]